MSFILLDTSAYSRMLMGHVGICDCVQSSPAVAISAVSLGELFGGLRHRPHEVRARTLDAFLLSPRIRVLDVTLETARRYAHIYADLAAKGTPIPANDIWIAACAMEHGLELVTCDRHFERIEQILVRCFAPDDPPRP